MTSFTKISDTEKATISIHPSRKISKINPNIYSGFTEYAGASYSYLKLLNDHDD